jgi:hypothetical protein
MRLEQFPSRLNPDPDALDPRLKQALQKSVFGLELRHPYVYQVPFYCADRANASLHETSSRVEECVAGRRWGSAVILIQRPYRMIKVAEWLGMDGGMSDHELRDILPFLWMDTEFPHQFEDLPHSFFQRTGYVSDTETRLQGLLTVYRGCTQSDLGLSWTLDFERAKWFASRFADDMDSRYIFRAQIHADEIWGYFEDRNEKEVVVNPACLRHLERGEIDADDEVEFSPYIPE